MWSVRCLHTEAIECLPQALCTFPVLYMFTCVGACSCLCPCWWVCHMLVCEDREAHHVPSSLLSALFPWDRFFPEPGVLPLGAGQGWQSESPSASRISIPLLPSLQLGVTGVHSHVQLFTRIVGIWAQVLLLAQQELLSTELSPSAHIFLDEISHWTQSSQTQLDWLARETPDAPCLCLLSTRSRGACCCSQLLDGHRESQIRSSCLCDKYFIHWDVSPAPGDFYKWHHLTAAWSAGCQGLITMKSRGCCTECWIPRTQHKHLLVETTCSFSGCPGLPK